MALRRRSITEFTAFVLAPSPDRSIGSQGDAIGGSGSDGDYVGEQTTLFILRYDNRKGAVSCGAVTELTFVIGTPSQDPSVGSQREAVPAASGKGDDCIQRLCLFRPIADKDRWPLHLHWECTVRGRSVA
jgi:hypothetical protein